MLQQSELHKETTEIPRPGRLHREHLSDAVNTHSEYVHAILRITDVCSRYLTLRDSQTYASPARNVDAALVAGCVQVEVNGSTWTEGSDESRIVAYSG